MQMYYFIFLMLEVQHRSQNAKIMTLVPFRGLWDGSGGSVSLSFPGFRSFPRSIFKTSYVMCLWPSLVISLSLNDTVWKGFPLLRPI